MPRFNFNIEYHELPQLFKVIPNTNKRPIACLCPDRLCKRKSLDLSEKWGKGHYNLNEEDLYSKMIKHISHGGSLNNTVKEMANQHLQLMIHALKRTSVTPEPKNRCVRIIHFHPFLYDEGNDSFPSYIHDASVAEAIYGDDADLYKIKGRECWYVVPTLFYQQT